VENMQPVKLRQPLWEDVPDTVHIEGTRAKDLLAKHCQSLYNDKGIRIVLGLFLEGRGGAPFKKDGLFFERQTKDIIGARICVKMVDWDVSISSYRQFLWYAVSKAIWGCVERLKNNKIAVNEAKLKLDLSLAEVEFFGSDSRLAAVEIKETGAPKPLEDTSDDEGVPLVIQYRIKDHGSRSDHDKRAKVEHILGEVLQASDLGYCDGGDIGSGTINVFCFVKPSQGAGKKTIDALRKNNLLEGATIVETVKGEERVIWPADFKGDFQLIYR